MTPEQSARPGAHEREIGSLQDGQGSVVRWLIGATLSGASYQVAEE